ncbi:MAG TPA: argininosuccinate synthase [Planctomycetota bacterium]|nr:argininosuccinate synthase [Planctomycetota bacterium]
MDKIVLAFSGGLDTSFCALWLREKTGAEIVTVTVDTGGFTPEELSRVETRARSLGVREHRTVDAREAVYDRFVSYLIKGNSLRGDVYPMCVGAERTVQAEQAVQAAVETGAKGVAHGSTGAGNDQVRFDVAIRALAPDLQIHTPVRDLNWTREQATAYLAERGIETAPKTTAYSVNVGLFGTTIGGKETHDTWAMPPEEVYSMTVAPEQGVDTPEEVVIGFEEGLPVSLDGTRMPGVDLVAALNQRARPHGVGRGVHVGDTILGLKGRLAFEAPGPLVLIKAHRELEKLVQTKWQAHWRDAVGAFYGSMLHEGLYFDPVMRDFEAFLDSVNERVTGDVRVRLYKGNYDVVGTRSPHSLFDRRVATYGEGAKAWSGTDAAGFSRIFGVPSMLAALRDRRS